MPPAINQFRSTLEKNHSAELFRLLGKYKPETKQAKKARLLSEAKARAEGKEVAKSKPVSIRYGLNSVTGLVEQNEARLVVIAHDVDPIELVVWLPTLCQKKNIPYVIVKGRSRLGQVVGKKTCAVLALTSVHADDRATLAQLAEVAKANFNERSAHFRRTWGGLAFGVKSQHRRNARDKLARDQADAKKQLSKIDK